MAGNAAALTEELLGDFETVILSFGGGGVWVKYFWGGTVIVIIRAGTSKMSTFSLSNLLSSLLLSKARPR